MTGSELRAARRTLGELWGLGRPLSMSEMGRALRLSGRDVGATIRDYEAKDAVSGPISVAIDLMLGGAGPADPVTSIVDR